MDDPVTLELLAKLEEDRARQQSLADDATERRNTALLRLLERGERQSAIASALGISAGRVSQIAQRAREVQATAA